MSIFYSGAMIAGAFGNLIAAGILDGLAGVHGLSAWRWLYIIEGAGEFKLISLQVVYKTNSSQ